MSSKANQQVFRDDHRPFNDELSLQAGSLQGVVSGTSLSTDRRSGLASIVVAGPRSTNLSNQSCVVLKRVIQTDGRSVFNEGYTRLRGFPILNPTGELAASGLASG
jgi:hypothetical protein